MQFKIPFQIQKGRPYKGKAYERARLKKVYWFVEDEKPKCPTKPLGKFNHVEDFIVNWKVKNTGGLSLRKDSLSPPETRVLNTIGLTHRSRESNAVCFTVCRERLPDVYKL